MHLTEEPLKTSKRRLIKSKRLQAVVKYYIKWPNDRLGGYWWCLIFLLILKSHPHILEVDNKFPVRH